MSSNNISTVAETASVRLQYRPIRDYTGYKYNLQLHFYNTVTLLLFKLSLLVTVTLTVQFTVLYSLTVNRNKYLQIHCHRVQRDSKRGLSVLVGIQCYTYSGNIASSQEELVFLPLFEHRTDEPLPQSFVVAPRLRNRLPVGGGCVYVLQYCFSVFFSVFSVHQNYETTVLGNG